MAVDKNYDAIVVGGGHNGLVAASYLARAGKKVVLLEAEAELGGATTSVRPFPEFDARLSRLLVRSYPGSDHQKKSSERSPHPFEGIEHPPEFNGQRNLILPSKT